MSIDFNAYSEDPPPPRRVTLTRAQLGSVEGLDVTAKSATSWRCKLAPTWSMVQAHKWGSCHDGAFSLLYIDHIDPPGRPGHLPLTELWDYGWNNEFKICFLCYCPDGEFCHTHLLIDHLLKTYPAYFIDGRSEEERVV